MLLAALLVMQRCAQQVAVGWDMGSETKARLGNMSAVATAANFFTKTKARQGFSITHALQQLNCCTAYHACVLQRIAQAQLCG